MKQILLITAALMIMSIQSKSQETLDIKALKAEYSWTIPEKSFITDTIVIKGEIENYAPYQSIIKTFECYSFDEFEEQTASSLSINPDGTFEKKIRISYPIYNVFYKRFGRKSFDIPFFAFPGDTVEVVAKFKDGKLECTYPTGRCKQFERLLQYFSSWNEFAKKTIDYDDGFDNFADFAETIWNELLTKVYHDGLNATFSKEEMSLALSLAQSQYAYLTLVTLSKMLEDCYETKTEGDFSYLSLKDTALYNRMIDPAYYQYLNHIDFSDKALLCDRNMMIVLNYIPWGLFPYSQNHMIGNHYPPQDVENTKAYFPHSDSLLRKTLHTTDNSLTAQMIMYHKIRMFDKMVWKNMPTDSIKMIRDFILPKLEFKPIRIKAEQLFYARLNDSSSTYPMRKCEATAFIDSLRNVYKGKYLYLDFWQMSCGPCRMAIESSKDLRKKIAQNPDIKLVFVNGDNPKYEAMKNYVKQHLADEVTIAPGGNTFIALRDVFNFSGIPHFEVITPNGNVVKEDCIDFGIRHNNDYEQFVQGIEKMKEKVEK
ncbi:MAG: thioredoxin family protein [Bacteroidales bacterium]|nr:thioredoxin family protein [Bacteroidales bacterium]